MWRPCARALGRATTAPVKRWRAPEPSTPAPRRLDQRVSHAVRADPDPCVRIIKREQRFEEGIELGRMNRRSIMGFHGAWSPTRALACHTPVLSWTHQPHKQERRQVAQERAAAACASALRQTMWKLLGATLCYAAILMVVTD